MIYIDCLVARYIIIITSNVSAVARTSLVEGHYTSVLDSWARIWGQLMSELPATISVGAYIS